jgi:hypothetical protein
MSAPTGIKTQVAIQSPSRSAASRQQRSLVLVTFVFDCKLKKTGWPQDTFLVSHRRPAARAQIIQPKTRMPGSISDDHSSTVSSTVTALAYKGIREKKPHYVRRTTTANIQRVREV